MSRKDRIDAVGALGLLAFSLLLGGNQIVVKLTNEGLQPVFQAGLRSAGAFLLILLWIRIRRIPISVSRREVPYGLLLGLLFAIEFICLFKALDLTTVSRASIIFYSMPLHLSLAAHLLLPGERLTGRKLLGLLLALGGVVVVMADRSAGEGSLAGDLLALAGAVMWASLALTVRLTPLSDVRAETQLLWQLGVSAPVLLLAAPLFGPFIRDTGWEYAALMTFQIVMVAGIGFLFWLALLKIYPASSVASFSFLSPVLSVVLAVLLLGEPVHLSIFLALALVAAGIFLVNR